uniref:Heat shock protein beta-2-like protein n=1 Tax=Callorhinchus milii TaxID=7868 RepID=V9KW59_CALMI|eukprot:gi/632985663/ref/XP_007909809.1/ PREDICTED: heat shock protein beta-2 [Callorhinchus milii]
MEQKTIPHAYPMSVEYESEIPARIYDQNFGEGLSPEDILAPTLYHGYYIRPRINKQLDRGFSALTTKDDKFQILLDVCQFLPDEISIRTIDNLLEVTARHPQKMDSYGFISREFTRTYILPLDVDPLLVHVTLSHDGILCIEAVRKGEATQPQVCPVKIHIVPPPAQPGTAKDKE